jgi:hypothetical protein
MTPTLRFSNKLSIPQTSMCRNKTISPTPPAPAPKPYVGSISVLPDDETGDPETNVRRESKLSASWNIIVKVVRELRRGGE